jgi:hypothetical protein
MSIDPEDSVLEEALRRDLPSADTEARLRRRLLAAGVAVGNGIATTTAAASGAAVSNAAATGLVAKVAGLSWGLTLGVVAAVAIPSLGLWIDGRNAAEPSAARPALVSRATVTAPSKASAVVVAAEPVRVIEERPQRNVVAREARPTSGVAPTVVNTPVAVAHPSQTDFAEPAATRPARPATSTLGDETLLLDGAFAALAAGDRASAAKLIAQHESSYPRGLLKTERERAKIRLSELSRGE